MTEFNKELYNILNNQYNLMINRVQAVESKAINLTLFSGAILGLEYTILNDFFSNILANNKDFLFYLVTISSSFFISSIVLGVIALIEPHNFYISNIYCSDARSGDNKLFENSSDQINKCLKENGFKIESKERFLRFAILSFLLGVFFIIWLFNHIMRYSLYS